MKNLHPQSYFKEAIRYYQNSKGLLKTTKTNLGVYVDTKPVREACSTCYLAVLNAINGYLLQYGVEREKLPKSFDEYLRALKKFSQKDGNLMKYFNLVYHELHVLGYYRDDLYAVDMVKVAFGNAKYIIEHITGRKL
ncbi:MAG: DUF5618 family protein [Elusimicrobiota bacterium]